MDQRLLENKRITSDFLKQSHDMEKCRQVKKSPSSLSAFVWINVTSALVILILLCCASPVAEARVLVRRPGNDDEGRGKALLEKPHVVNDSPNIFDEDPDEEAQIKSFKEFETKKDIGIDPHDYKRDARAVAAYYKKDDPLGVKHVQRIPSSTGGQGKDNVRRGTPPPPEESSDDDTLESLEANREAFLEMLNEHAKHPHRHRSSKKHSVKMILKFDEKTQKWQITEPQSDEWF